jgi:exopolysaccharide biosynthesis polyprenyl glycosylphosphotransferase
MTSSVTTTGVRDLVKVKPYGHFWQPVCLLLLDVLSIFGAFFLAYWVRNGLVYQWTLLKYQWTPNHLIFLALFAGVAVFMFRYMDLYKEYMYVTGIRQSIMLIKGVALLGLLIIFFAFYGKVALLLESRILITAFIVCLFFFLLLFRLVAFRKIRRLLFTSGRWVRRVLVIGDEKTAKEVSGFIRAAFPDEKECIGFIGEPTDADSIADASIPYLGGRATITKLLAHSGVNEVYLATPNLSPEEVIETIGVCRNHNVEINLSSRSFGVVGEKIDATFFGAGQRFIPFSNNVTHRFERMLKRFTDVVVSFLLLALIWPLLLLIGFLIRRDSPGPAVFLQERAGLDGKPFTMLKFRTMKQDTSPNAHIEARRAIANDDKAFFEDQGVSEEGEQTFKLASGDSITRFGHFLRRTSMDELPQIFNVLMGQMSLVGPRPLPMYELENFKPWHFRRMDVKPGITGLWQVTSRSQVSIDDWFMLDIYYAMNWSFLLDVSLLIRTFPAVVSARGAH